MNSERQYLVTPVELEHHGLMFEVLPYVFLGQGFLDGHDGYAIENLKYIESPVVSEYATRGSFEEFVSQATFARAKQILTEALGHDSDVSLVSEAEFRPSVLMPPLIAHAIHRDQVDQLGVPFIEHARSAAHQVEEAMAENLEVFGNPELEAGKSAAWLKNVIRDSARVFYRQVTLDDLFTWGVSERTVHIVDLLTPHEKQPAEVQTRRLLTDSVARTVKLAELALETNKVRFKALAPNTQDKLRVEQQQTLDWLGYHPEVDNWFEPLVQLRDNLHIGFALDESIDALTAALSIEPLPQRYIANISGQEFNSAHGIAMTTQAMREFGAETPDSHIALGLFWQFYQLEAWPQAPYNSALIREFYKRKSALAKPASAAGFYDLSQLTIAEVIKRARRAKQNFERFNLPHYKQEFSYDLHNHPTWSEFDELDRDAAAEVLLVAFAGFDTGDVLVHDIKWFITCALNRIFPRSENDDFDEDEDEQGLI